ncbi:MAG: GIY-YIG nuclease family protein [Candidatus Thorarchaeota archaeon]|jgi:putative endonuclease
MVYYVYIIETVNKTLYTGQTNDLARRLTEHLSGNSKSAAYFRMHPPRFLVHVEEFQTRGEAMRRERQIKRNRALKMRLVGERRAIEDIISSE